MKKIPIIKEIFVLQNIDEEKYEPGLPFAVYSKDELYNVKVNYIYMPKLMLYLLLFFNIKSRTK